MPIGHGSCNQGRIQNLHCRLNGDFIFLNEMVHLLAHLEQPVCRGDSENHRDGDTSWGGR